MTALPNSDHALPRPRLRFGPLTLAAFGVALLVAIPALVVAASVVEPAGAVWAHLWATTLPGLIGTTLVLVLGVGVGTAVIGTGAAWLVTMCRFPGARQLDWLLLLPLAMPAYIMAYAYTDALVFAGPVQSALRGLTGWRHGDYWFPEIQSLGGAITVLTLALYPYVYLLARAAFLEQSVCVLEVSRTLGRGPWGAFAGVALPLARPAIAGGVALALMEALADFGTVQFFGIDTFTTAIYRTWFGMGDPRAAAQLAAVLMLLVLGLIALERLSRGRARYFHTSRRYRPLPRPTLHGAAAGGAILACVLPILLGFAVPAGILLNMAIDGGDPLFGARFLTFAGNSFLLSGGAAILTVGAALLIAYGQRLAPSPAIRLAARLSGVGYALPGSVIAVGILIPFATLDNAIDAWMRKQFGISTGLILSGTVIALLYAYVARFLAVGLNAVEAGLGKITPSMDAAARTLGRGPTATLAQVHAPIMLGSLATAAILVFVDVLKELPATLIVRPFNFDTLSIRAYSLASDERLAESSTASLCIVAVGLLPILILSRMLARSRPGIGDP
jgi:iron(III) transport system permease protein